MIPTDLDTYKHHAYRYLPTGSLISRLGALLATVQDHLTRVDVVGLHELTIKEQRDNLLY